MGNFKDNDWGKNRPFPEKTYSIQESKDRYFYFRKDDEFKIIKISTKISDWDGESREWYGFEKLTNVTPQDCFFGKNDEFNGRNICVKQPGIYRITEDKDKNSFTIKLASESKKLSEYKTLIEDINDAHSQEQIDYKQRARLFLYFDVLGKNFNENGTNDEVQIKDIYDKLVSKLEEMKKNKENSNEN